ncbi:MAG: P-II family nitrogen regulator [Fidelibacterota bacterium]|nr:MAG: P-II family nitrogen regulator [Candidatus Neomarinimicrobiota bacterium]
MKEIKAYVRPDRIDDVILALEAKGVQGMTVIDVYALAGWTDPRRTSYSTKYVEKYGKVVKLELICSATDVETMIETIRSAASTGHPGDGKIFVADIYDAVSIRTGKRGYEAI